MTEVEVSKLPKRRLLVFGSGFIAAHFALYARNVLSWHVGVVYRHYCNPALEGLIFGKLPNNASELADMLGRFEPTDILIAVGSSYVPAINRDIGKALDEHLNTTLFILNAQLSINTVYPARILVVGSASEYGVFESNPIDETRFAQPQDAYGVIKLAQYQLGLHYVNMHNLNIVHARQFNVTGIGQNLNFVVPSICSQAAAYANKNIEASETSHQIVAGNTSVRRDFLSITDVCEAYSCLLDEGVAGEVYNVSSGSDYSIDELIMIASGYIGLKLEVKIDPDLVRKSDRVVSYICGNPNKLMALGWKPRVPMEALIPEMIADYQLKKNI